MMWAITTFYNPMGYKRRLHNFRQFRDALNLPLVVVELDASGSFSLDADDADVLIRLKGEPFLWQKERLLNVALQHVPRRAQSIAWLDCDIVFDRDDWVKQAEAALETYPIAQAFSELYDLDKDVSITDVTRHPNAPTGVSIAKLMRTDEASIDDFRPTSSDRVRRGLFGLAWVGRRTVLERHGFYDAMILGSGDRMMACGAFGRFDDGIFSTRLDDTRAAHYLRWAKPFFADIKGNVGCLEGRILHLWHGDVKDRKYVDRHIRLAKLEFDPSSDIAIADNGCWMWTGGKERFEPFMRQYFAARKEDGVDAVNTFDAQSSFRHPANVVTPECCQGIVITTGP